MSTLTSAFPSFNRGKAHRWNSSWLHQCFWTHERWMHTKSIFISAAHLITAAKLLWVATHRNQISNLKRAENFSWHLLGCQPLPPTYSSIFPSPEHWSQEHLLRSAKAMPMLLPRSEPVGHPTLHPPVCLCIAPQLCRHAELPRATVQLPCGSYLLGEVWHVPEEPKHTPMPCMCPQ